MIFVEVSNFVECIFCYRNKLPILFLLLLEEEVGSDIKGFRPEWCISTIYHA